MKKQVLKINWERQVPPGFDWQTERWLFVAAYLISCLWSFGFFIRFSDAVHYVEPGPVPYFYELLGKAFFCFPIAIAFMLASIAMNYAHHHSGSKSIYLMRRLPNSWELHRRCLTVPLWSAAISLLTAAALFFVFYFVYMYWIGKHGYHPHANQLELVLKYWSVM